MFCLVERDYIVQKDKYFVLHLKFWIQSCWASRMYEKKAHNKYCYITYVFIYIYNK